MRWSRVVALAAICAGCARSHARQPQPPAPTTPSPVTAASPGTDTVALIPDSILLRKRHVELRVGQEFDMLEVTPPVRVYADGSEVLLWRWEIVYKTNEVFGLVHGQTIRAMHPGKADIVFKEPSAPSPNALRASGRVTVTVIP